MSPPDLREVYAEGLLMFYELCPPCTASFKAWQCAPNPANWANPEIAASPYLLGFLQACRAAGPDPQQWRDTISRQLLLIRRTCTDRHNAHDLGYGYEGRAFVLGRRDVPLTRGGR